MEDEKVEEGEGEGEDDISATNSPPPASFERSFDPPGAGERERERALIHGDFRADEETNLLSLPWPTTTRITSVSSSQSLRGRRERVK